MIQAVLGIDVAKDTLDVALIQAGKTWQERFDNQVSGFKRLLRWVEKQVGGPVHACLESTGQYSDGVAEYLYEHGYAVSVVNPARIKAYGASKLRRNKTDRADAQLIAEYGLREQPGLWSPPPASFRELQSLVRRLEDLQAQLQQENNRLKSGVKHPLVIADLQDHLQELEGRIARIKRAIGEHISAHPELKQRVELLTSIPGIGRLTAAKILGEVRDVCAFDDARQLAAYAGVTPRNFTSGTSVHKKARMSKTGNANLRKALYMPAISAKRHNSIIRAFCDRLSASGLQPMQIIGAAMRKLLHLIYGILKSGRPFDPNFLTTSSLTP